MGAIIRIVKIINPNGFNKMESKRSPFNKYITDRVEPHDGQGMFVIRLKMQTVSLEKFPFAKFRK